MVGRAVESLTDGVGREKREWESNKMSNNNDSNEVENVGSKKAGGKKAGSKKAGKPKPKPKPKPEPKPKPKPPPQRAWQDLAEAGMEQPAEDGEDGGAVLWTGVRFKQKAPQVDTTKNRKKVTMRKSKAYKPMEIPAALEVANKRSGRAEATVSYTGGGEMAVLTTFAGSDLRGFEVNGVQVTIDDAMRGSLRAAQGLVITDAAVAASLVPKGLAVKQGTPARPEYRHVGAALGGRRHANASARPMSKGENRREGESTPAGVLSPSHLSGRPRCCNCGAMLEPEDPTGWCWWCWWAKFRA
jgi:hypothetical protein